MNEREGTYLNSAGKRKHRACYLIGFKLTQLATKDILRNPTGNLNVGLVIR